MRSIQNRFFTWLSVQSKAAVTKSLYRLTKARKSTMYRKGRSFSASAFLEVARVLLLVSLYAPIQFDRGKTKITTVNYCQRW
ncbi:hypothetical protein H8S90_12475 [Olivibacter sp. SDN3]|uniref:hypothetical protein n=1 Tax=Olivibacter sp. SDN3 TaxID=2764720 RepID=UPI001650EFC8|nr:hypothetical protein [Olivibacter sp. SDN3]QNL52307.1 hypothetical protein H8S90_12475 [Olivibacter sp. SDN3]